jgi:hypothetical protein
MHYIAYDPAFFINGKKSVAESYTEDRKYLYRFHPCNDILKRLYEVFEKSKKQDLTPWFETCLTHTKWKRTDESNPYKKYKQSQFFYIDRTDQSYN